MGNENTARKLHRTATNRKKLSEITNTPLADRFRTLDENLQTSVEVQLRKELADVKKSLQDKEEMIRESKRYLEKLWTNYSRRTKQNDEIILQNTQLSKDLIQARDKLKVLQHENAQMSALHKAYKLEMEKKLSEALERVRCLTAMVESHALREVNCSEKNASCGPPLHSTCDELSAATCRINVKKRESKSRGNASKIKTKQTNEQSMSSICEGKETNEGSNKNGGNEKASPDFFSGSSRLEDELKMVVPAFHCSDAGKISNKDDMDIDFKLAQIGEDTIDKTDKMMHSFDIMHVSTRKISGRPLRRAVSSIGSYREPPLNRKMRRAS